MEENEVKNEIEIAEEAIAVIAGAAIRNMEGMSKTVTGFVDGITEALGKKNLGKGIKVEISEQDVRIEVGIIIKYGAKIPEVGAKIQEKITKDVEEMTGYKVKGVKVRVQSVQTDLDNKEENVQEAKK